VHPSGKDSVDHGRSGHDDYANAVCGCLRSLAHASFDIWNQAYGDAEEPPSEPDPFQHQDPDYWKDLARQINSYSRGQYWPT
jgi:hypothetical protein